MDDEEITIIVLAFWSRVAKRILIKVPDLAIRKYQLLSNKYQVLTFLDNANKQVNNYKKIEDEVYVAKETYVNKYATFMTEFIQFCSEIRIYDVKEK